ncbi:uncharacterized protein [Chelonus insularis]|uniref:uncharacterized protein isoform X2 n=1 Tax=Chelonus insularis TaxID=460826 RepID=UPI00158B8EC4|nr:uncharacterized protein LOC118065502 isoform X2 [Chelonus insularis]
MTSMNLNIIMKIFSVIVCISVIVSTLAEEDELDPHAAVREKCKDELKLTDEILKQGIQNPKDFGCYLYCFLKDIKVMNDKGVFNPEIAIQSIREELRDAAKTHISTCFESDCYHLLKVKLYMKMKSLILMHHFLHNLNEKTILF